MAENMNFRSGLLSSNVDNIQKPEESTEYTPSETRLEISRPCRYRTPSDLFCWNPLTPLLQLSTSFNLLLRQTSAGAWPRMPMLHDGTSLMNYTIAFFFLFFSFLQVSLQVAQGRVTIQFQPSLIDLDGAVNLPDKPPTGEESNGACNRIVSSLRKGERGWMGLDEWFTYPSK